jgi:2-dehydro-3-deoxy-D-gluconate 5-dehydrogenase
MDLTSFSLAGKVAIVTGANKGLGQAIALALSTAGADVVGVSRGAANETAAQIETKGGRFLGIEADLGSLEPIDNIISSAIGTFGKIDILVNNAGIIRREDSVAFTEADWDDVMNLNIKSAFFLCQAVGKQMIGQGGGKIINVASMLSFQGGIRVPSYTASKSGLAGITKLLACEWACHGINVNAIAPGYMDTDNTAQLRADETRARDILARIPAGRWGKPADIGGAAVFLASAASDYMNGAIIPVDGGWLAR